MKGTLHKTESGWQVWYHAKEDLFYGNTGVRILPLLQEDAAGLFIQDTDSKHDGKEVEFEIIDFPSNSISKYAKLVDKATRPLTEDDAWPEYPSKLHQLQIHAAEECFRKYPNNEYLYTTDELKNAYKAGIIDGLKEWTLDSYDKPKYPEVKIVCPRCKAIMPCECNAQSWDDILRAFYIAEKQVPIGARRLIIDVWLTENYNPPTKKQDYDK